MKNLKRKQNLHSVQKRSIMTSSDVRILCK